MDRAKTEVTDLQVIRQKSGYVVIVQVHLELKFGKEISRYLYAVSDLRIFQNQNIWKKY
jgi:hypothetical protein